MTPAGWRDVLLNARLVKTTSQSKSYLPHIVEIQIHAAPLLATRKEAGGHAVYAKLRAVTEALEVAGLPPTDAMNV